MLRPVAIVFLRQLFLLLVLNLLPVRRLMPRESIGSFEFFSDLSALSPPKLVNLCVSGRQRFKLVALLPVTIHL
mgnify:CR=1 FL=1